MRNLPPANIRAARLRWAGRLVGWVALLCAINAPGTHACGFAREDEFECEEAMAQLSRCCGTAPPISCAYEERFCGANVEPELSVQAGRCVRTMSCERLRELGACDPASEKDPRPNRAAEHVMERVTLGDGCR